MLRPNPYYVDEEASDYNVPQGGLAFGVSVRGDRSALPGARKYQAPQGAPLGYKPPSIDDY